MNNKVIYQFHNGYAIYFHTGKNEYGVDGQKGSFSKAEDACQYIDKNLKTR